MPRIVLLEVDPDVQRLLQETLQQRGYAVHCHECRPGSRIGLASEPDTYLLLTVDREASLASLTDSPRDTLSPRPTLLTALCRSLTVWTS